MNKYLFSFVSLFICQTVFADYTFFANENVHSFSDENVFINDDVHVTASSGSDIIVDAKPLYLYNNGYIDGRIDTNGNNLFLYNSGIISGGITTQNGGFVTQRITSEAQATPIDVIGGNFVVEIDSCKNLDFNSFDGFTANAFTISDSSIVINNFTDWQNWDKNVSFEGTVTLYINNLDVDDNDVVIKHVGNYDQMIIYVDGIDDLHKVRVLYDSNHNPFLKVVRENDLYKVFTFDDRDNVIKEIRTQNPNDKLIQNLDAAHNLPEIFNVINSSYRFNHKILLRPIKVINNFSNFIIDSDIKNIGIGTDAFYITAKNMDDFGGNFYFAGSYEDWYMKIGLNINSFKYADNINDFKGNRYGLDLTTNKYLGKFWINGNAGFAVTKYDANNIYLNDSDIQNNPIAYSVYGAIHAGYDYSVNNGLIISPLGGVLFQYTKLLDINDTDVNGIGGAKLKYSFVTDDIKYEYKTSGAIGTNTDLFANFEFGFWSVVDLIGATFDVDIFKNEFDTNFKFSAHLKIEF